MQTSTDTGVQFSTFMSSRMRHVSRSLNLHFGAFSVIIFALIQSCRGQSQVVGPSQPIVAMVGDDVVLPCHLAPVMDASGLTVEWARPELDPRFVLVWRDGVELQSKKHPTYEGRTSLFMSELKLGNVSLKLSKVKLSDEGTYRCFIPRLVGNPIVQVVVGVTSSPVIQMSRNISGVDLLCKSEGWYPEPEVLWLDGEGNLLSAGPPETVRGPDDLYTVSSRVTVEKRHSNRFTCRVQQKNINQTRETHINVPDDFFPDPPSSSSSATIAGLVVVVVTLLILSVVFGVWKWRQNKIRNKKHHEDEETQKVREEKKNHSEQQSLMDREQLTADRQTENDLDKEEKGPETQIDEETHRGESTDVLIQFSLEGGKQTNRHFAEGRTESDFDKETETEPNNQRGAALNPAEREEESNRGNEEDETNSVNGNTEQLMEERQTENNLQTEEGQEEIKSTAQYLMEDRKHGEQLMVDRETVNNLDKEKETLKTKNREKKEWERKVSRLEGQMKDKEEQIKKVKEQLEEVDREREERKIHSVNMEEDEDTMKDLEKKKAEFQKQLQRFETALEGMKKKKNIMIQKKNKATKDQGQKKKLQTCYFTGQHQVIGPSQPIIATVGDDVILPCHLDPVMDISDMILEWARPDLDPRFVLVRRNGFELEWKKHSSYQGRTSLFMSELKLGNVSLKLSKVKTSDEGRYRCFIPELNLDSNIQLVVGATSSPVIQMSRNISGVDLLCKSEGWYPEPEVLWLDGEGNLLSAGPPETVRGPDDLYTVSSRVTVEKRHSNRFTCRVQQKNINQTREAHIHVPDDFFPDAPSSSSSATIAGLVVVGILLILSIVFGVWKWRQNKIRNKKVHQDEETQKMREKKNQSEQESLMDREQLTAEGKTLNDLQKERENLKKELQIKKKTRLIFDERVSRLEGQMKVKEEQLKKVKEQQEEVDRQREETLRARLEIIKKEKKDMIDSKNKATKDIEELTEKIKETETQIIKKQQETSAGPSD
ncbi:hypothetical protein L3Q82_016497 [Scortum barcoo]|uniref:Uncharacterized protein n=1 Tax=Scortum barcoo TaxID=214431 RepID=A0ACB8XAM5_9TELE|nr:hypothetical protein L3Q82_016497 [Scortum barcoo]